MQPESLIPTALQQAPRQFATRLALFYGALFGWDVRVVLLAVLALAGHATLAETGLAAIVGGSFLLHAVADWRKAGEPA